MRMMNSRFARRTIAAASLACLSACAGMAGGQNCHLHYFEPDQEAVAFPCRMQVFDPVEGRRVRRLVPHALQVATETHLA